MNGRGRGSVPSEFQDEDIKVEEKKVDARMLLDFFADIFCLAMYSIFVYLKIVFRFFVPQGRKSLKGEIVLITGGANGIGRELCRNMVRYEKDFKLVIWDIDVMEMDGFIRELKDCGLKHVYGYEVDVSSRAQVENCATKVRQEVGEVTMLINNAGIAGPLGEAWNLDPAIVEKVFMVNLISHGWTMREFLPSMLKNNHGHVLEMCSVLSFCSGRWGSSYVSTKQGLKGYVEAVKEDIRYEYRNSSVVVAMAFPSFTDTALTTSADMRAEKYPFLLQPLRPEDVAAEIFDGLLRNKEYIFIPVMSWFTSWMVPLIPMDICRKLIDIADVTGRKSVNTIVEELTDSD